MRKIKYKKGRKVKPTILEYTGIHKQVKSEMQLFVYDTDDLTEFAEFDVSQIHNCIDETKVNWLNIHGLNDIELIKSIGHFLKFDHFMLGDILNTTKRKM